MRVLSIDLDYIMGPVIELYQSLGWDDNPAVRWKRLYNTSDFRDSHLYIDQSSLIFCYESYLRALKNCQSVSFGYDHDSILYSISEYENIDIVNIDHHDDFFHVGVFGEYASGLDALRLEYKSICEEDHVNEGNWGAWLHSKGKLNSFTWIRNETSKNIDRTPFIQELMGERYKVFLKEEYRFNDYTFDHIFVCLSPQYVPKHHWHYFTMFMMTYEELTGNIVDINSFGKKKFENENRNNQVTDEILYKRSNGW